MTTLFYTYLAYLALSAALTVVVLAISIIQKPHRAQKGCAFGTLPKAVFEPGPVHGDGAVRLKVQNAGTPVCRHRLGEKRDDEARNILWLHEYERVAEVNAFVFPASDAIALEWCLFSGERDSEVATGSQPRPRNLLNGNPCVVFVLNVGTQLRGLVLQETVHVVVAHRTELRPTASRGGWRCDYRRDNRLCRPVHGHCTACR